jgi:hypothetical protein
LYEKLGEKKEVNCRRQEEWDVVVLVLIWFAVKP